MYKLKNRVNITQIFNKFFISIRTRSITLTQALEKEKSRPSTQLLQCKIRL